VSRPLPEPVTVDAIARQVGGIVVGDGERRIARLASLERAGPDAISFLNGRRHARAARASAAGALLVAPALQDDAPTGAARVLVADPYVAYARLSQWFESRLAPAGRAAAIDPAAHVDPSARIGPGVEVGPGASIAAGASVGEGSRIGAGCAIGEGVSIGRGSVLHPGVVVYTGVTIGARAVVHAGTVIGSDGFGFAPSPDGYVKIAQLGSVRIGDDVEIGANCAIDRGALDDTEIGDGVKIDNMVHVGHNCRIGNHVVVAAQTGFSGAVVVEDYAVIGGQVGIGDKARIESKAVLGSGCGVLTSKVIRSGEVVWGTPARPLKEILEQLANVAKLPAMRKELLELKQQVARLLDEERA
jgi:UDP-3-O-[3-hydroxymyristoyl] glucosamine N-acyltransferase